MAPVAIDRVGQRFGRLIVSNLHHTDKHYNRFWLCVCDCGKQKIVGWSALSSGGTVSCGCFNIERVKILCESRVTHGHSRRPRTRAYRCWCNMLTRCRNTKNKGYKNYGGRGIKVLYTSFENFLADVGNPPSGHTLDRIDNNGNYEPGNCRWTTPKQQTENRRPHNYSEAMKRAWVTRRSSAETQAKSQG
jgi:hypothetical protein